MTLSVLLRNRDTRIGGDNHHPSTTTMLDAPAQKHNHDSLELNCLIEGESNVFQIIAVIHKQVGNLQETIKSRASHTLKNVDACTLELRKASAVDKSLCKVVLAYSLSLTGRY